MPTPRPESTLPDDVAGLHAAVLEWFAAHARDLPWRDPDCPPWGVFVSEIMLQQTPVVRVLPRWRAWMERWPTPADLAAAPASEVLTAWDRLGYPRRALRLQEAARAVVEHHGGLLPADPLVGDAAQVAGVEEGEIGSRSSGTSPRCDDSRVGVGAADVTSISTRGRGDDSTAPSRAD